MNFTYENQGINTYLVYKVKEDDVIDSMSLGMVTNNSIPGLAATTFIQMDENKYIKYNVSAKISVKQFFSGPVNKRRLIGVFSSIVDAMIVSEDYMIDTDMVLLDLDYIFADVSTSEAILVCLPISSTEMRHNDFSTFFKQIMFSTQFDQSENCDYVAKIINYLNCNPVFSLMDFRNLLDEIKNGVAGAPAAPASPVYPPSYAPAPQPPVQPKPPMPPQPTPPQPPVQPRPPMPPQPTPPQPPVNNGPAGQPAPKPPMNIPGVPPKPPVPPTNKTETQNADVDPDEKPMSTFYLLQHYNAENAAKYKAQKAAKKASGADAAKKDKKEKKGSAPAGMAVPGQTQKPPMPPQPPVQPRPPMPPQPPVQRPPMPPQSSTPNFGETTVLGGGSIGETTVLSAVNVNQAAAPQPYLIRSKNNERIPVNKPVFRIGKEKSYVDYFISDNTAISRSHANIVSRDGKFFIVDTNSTNHTFIDGKMVPSNTEIEIVHGACLRLANEDFEFKVF